MLKDKMIQAFESRLASKGKIKKEDNTYVDAEIYSKEKVESFLLMGIAATHSVYPNSGLINNIDLDKLPSDLPLLYFDMSVQYAVICALGSQALLERGREFTTIDNGMAFTPPILSDILMNQYNQEMHFWLEKAKLSKLP